MSLASLLVMTEPFTFAFEHAMAHRNFLGAMSPLDAFTAVPYFLDPPSASPMFHLYHNRAHQDALAPTTALMTPVVPGERPGYIQSGPFQTELPLGVPFPQDFLMNTPTPTQERQKWWTWTNQQEHLAGMDILPTEATYPFW